MHHGQENDKLPVQELGRKLREQNVKIVVEPTPADIVVVLDKLKLKPNSPQEGNGRRSERLLLKYGGRSCRIRQSPS